MSRWQPGTSGREYGDGSMGLIDIENSPIPWINIWCRGSGEGITYGMDYGIPDPRPLPHIYIRSVRIRDFPLFGNVIDVRWNVNYAIRRDYKEDLRMAQHLTTDQAIRTAIIFNRDEITVYTRPEHGCWIIPHNGIEAPNPSQWECYQRIATVLTAPLT
jgi:hypothetical protein